jgi:hypothetical protein
MLEPTSGLEPLTCDYELAGPTAPNVIPIT